MVVYGGKIYEIDQASLARQSLYEINNHHMTVTVSDDDSTNKKLVLNFDYENILISSLFILDGKGLIIHSHNKMVWFDLDSGQILSQHKIDFIPKDMIEENIDHDHDHDHDQDDDNNYNLEKEGGETKLSGRVRIQESYVASHCYQAGNNLYAKLTNFNGLSDYMWAKIDYQGKIIMSYPIMAKYCHIFTTPTDFTVTKDHILEINFHLDDQPVTESYDLITGDPILVC